MLHSRASLAESRLVEGYVFDEARPDARFVVELVIDGIALAVATAAEFRLDLFENGVGDGCYGFHFKETALLATAEIAEVKLANLSTPIGAPIHLQSCSLSKIGAASHVEWLGGLTVAGWLRAPSGEAPLILVSVDGSLILEERANRWQRTPDASRRPVNAFHIVLPDRFADGKLHQVHVAESNGANLAGSPLMLMAAHDALAEILRRANSGINDRVVRTFLGRITPNSLPLDAYEAWDTTGAWSPPVAIDAVAGLVIIGSANEQLTLSSLHAQSHAKWVAVQLASDDDCVNFSPLDLKRSISQHLADVDFVIFLRSGTHLHRTSIERIAECFECHDQAVLVYGDTELEDEGRIWPMILPAFDYERQLEQGYISYFFAIRLSALPGDDFSTLYQLANALCLGGIRAPDSIWHLSGPIARMARPDPSRLGDLLGAASAGHLQSRGVSSSFRKSRDTLFPACHVVRESGVAPRTTIVIASRNRGAELEECITSIGAAAARANATIVVVDNETSAAKARRSLRRLKRGGVRVLPISGPWNLSRLYTSAVREIHSELVCFASDVIRADTDRWLEEMVGRLADPSVGAVGPLIVSSSGVVDHAGLVLGRDFNVSAAFDDRHESDVGYLDLLRVARDCSAVALTCMLTRRDVFMEVGGFDERLFPHHFADVDYCLTLGRLGLRVVFTPHARLSRAEPSWRDLPADAMRGRTRERELQLIRRRWGKTFADDPCYSSLFAVDGPTYSALAWPAVIPAPRTKTSPVPFDVPRWT